MNRRIPFAWSQTISAAVVLCSAALGLADEFVVNARDYYPEAHRWAVEKKLALLTGSDNPRPRLQDAPRRAFIAERVKK